MITALFIKNYKIYKKQRFIPITAQHKWSSFVGPNGAGKSSILEALDTFFNDSQWNINKTARRNSETTNFINLPFVCPLFLIKKQTWHDQSDTDADHSAIEAISQFFWSINSSTSTGTFPLELHNHIQQIAEEYNSDDFYLIASGIRFGIDIARPYFGPFHQQAEFIRALGINPSESSAQIERSKENDEAIAKKVGSSLNKTLRKIYSYIYIPSDISIADYTKLETDSMQILMGRDLNQEISKAITSAILDKINTSLDKTVEEATAGLDLYRYEKPTGGKKKITINTLSGLITREYFSIRELSRVVPDGAIPVSNLSSGEQRRALIDLTSNYLIKKAGIHQNTILAIDEPEISLHTSLCYEQFETLFDVAKCGPQCIVTTHWYGFLPIAQGGTTHFVERSDEEDSVRIESYDLRNYRERARKKVKTAKTKAEMPFDVSLKSANDLVQSIAASLRSPGSHYNWILCEGTSEQIYFSYFFRQEIEERKIRLLPLGGAGEVANIYRYLEAAFADKTFDQGGRVLALIDTDEELSRYSPNSSAKNLSFRRLLLAETDELRLLPVESTIVSPATEIEDCLDPAIFIGVLSNYDQNEHGIDFERVERRQGARYSGRALDLRDTERTKIKAFFDTEGRKVDFATRYVAAAKASTYRSDEAFTNMIREQLKLS